MALLKAKSFWIAAALLIAGSGAFLVYENHQLNLAHSTFENYYAFRGCSELIEKAEDKARCKLPDGTVISLVKINNKWYLEGDGPGSW